jgi:mono/diheme cytochrome c family protein
MGLAVAYCALGLAACGLWVRDGGGGGSDGGGGGNGAAAEKQVRAVPAAATGAEAERVRAERAEAGFRGEVLPVVQKYCLECHDSEKKAAGLALDVYKHADEVLAKREVWDLVSKYVRTGQMPPDEAEKHPTDEERGKVSGWVDGQLLGYFREHPDPGKVTLRRMNKSEYNHTIRDLVGVDFQPADDFPQDDSGYGFDNIGDVLSLPPVLMEKYLAAADRIMEEALPTEPPVSKVRHIAAAQAEVGFNALGDRGDGWVQLISLEEDDVAVEIPVPAGDYLVRVKAFCQPTGGALVGQGSSVPIEFKGEVEPTKLGIFVGDTFVKDLTIDAREDAPKVYEARVGVAAGKQRFRAVVRRNRGGENETYMLNGRIGKQQPGTVFVRYMEIEGPLPAAISRVPAEKLERKGEGRFNAGGGWVMEHEGEAGTTVEVKKAGECIVRVQAAAQQAGKEPARMEVRVNGEKVGQFEVIAPATLTPLPRQRLFDINLLNARPYVYEVRTKLPAGKSRVSVAFVNDFEEPGAENANLRDRNLIVNYLEVVNLGEALPPQPMPETFAGYFRQGQASVGTREAAREVVGAFMRRAWRRPVGGAEVERVMKLYDLARGDGGSFEEGLKLAMKGVLVSPEFLFLGQVHEATTGAAIGEGKEGVGRPIGELALASRLSYFLWSSMPDEELLGLAEKGQLRAHLGEEVKRMMASPKAEALVENFSGQWLQLRNMPNLAPDKTMFPGYDERLRKAMTRETELLFEDVMRGDRSVLTFLTADYTFVNGRLAQFYGLGSGSDGKPVTGEEFVKVSLEGTQRRGVLTQGSILTLTSNPTRTSPVKRGKFVLENLLGTPPPPPPPDVPKLEDQKAVTGTLRHQMEVHRTNPVCASCHAQMDPIGFGLENFDAIGKWRDADDGGKVDAAGRLKTGETFGNTEQLVEILATKRRGDFEHCLAEKMLTYALGRGVEMYDRPAVEGIVEKMEREDERFSALVMGVVESLPFQMERGEPVGDMAVRLDETGGRR